MTLKSEQSKPNIQDTHNYLLPLYEPINCKLQLISIEMDFV